MRVEQTGDEREAVLVGAEDNDKLATALTNEWATVYIEYRKGLMRQTLAAARREVQDRADKLLREAGTFQRREILRSLLAVEAGKKTRPDTQVVRFEGVGSQGLPLSTSVLLALLIGGGAALLLALMDGRLRTPAGVEASTGLPRC